MRLLLDMRPGWCYTRQVSQGCLDLHSVPPLFPNCSTMTAHTQVPETSSVATPVTADKVIKFNPIWTTASSYISNIAAALADGDVDAVASLCDQAKSALDRYKMVGVRNRDTEEDMAELEALIQTHGGFSTKLLEVVGMDDRFPTFNMSAPGGIGAALNEAISDAVLEWEESGFDPNSRPTLALVPIAKVRVGAQVRGIGPTVFVPPVYFRNADGTVKMQDLETEDGETFSVPMLNEPATSKLAYEWAEANLVTDADRLAMAEAERKKAAAPEKGKSNKPRVVKTAASMLADAKARAAANAAIAAAGAKNRASVS